MIYDKLPDQSRPVGHETRKYDGYDGSQGYKSVPYLRDVSVVLDPKNIQQVAWSHDVVRQDNQVHWAEVKVDQGEPRRRSELWLELVRSDRREYQHTLDDLYADHRDGNETHSALVHFSDYVNTDDDGGQAKGELEHWPGDLDIVKGNLVCAVCAA